ncbi:MAG: hypothetical protein HY046_13430 [Acidobacteria bacterium]|nr:hypothetical protein [Acidobacteriota bacterium]
MSTNAPDDRLLRLLRAAALIAVVVGTVGAEGLMLRAGQHTPRFLLVLFVGWVLMPFLALAWANGVSQHWPVLTRATLYCVTLAIALGTLAIFGDLLVVKPAGSARVFAFVAVPPASLFLMAVVVPLAALISRKRSR